MISCSHTWALEGLGSLLYSIAPGAPCRAHLALLLVQGLGNGVTEGKPSWVQGSSVMFSPMLPPSNPWLQLGLVSWESPT